MRLRSVSPSAVLLTATPTVGVDSPAAEQLVLWLFRSPVLALKAIVMNLLSIGAAFGLTVLVFQEGHGERLLGFTSPGYIPSWMPLTPFILLFGLSMDYEVFMVGGGAHLVPVGHVFDSTPWRRAPRHGTCSRSAPP